MSNRQILNEINCWILVFIFRVTSNPIDGSSFYFSANKLLELLELALLIGTFVRNVCTNPWKLSFKFYFGHQRLNILKCYVWRSLREPARRNQKLSKLFNKSNEKKFNATQKENKLKWIRRNVLNACWEFSMQIVGCREDTSSFQRKRNCAWKREIPNGLQCYEKTVSEDWPLYIDRQRFHCTRAKEMKLNVIGQRFHINHAPLIMSESFFFCFYFFILSIKWFCWKYVVCRLKLLCAKRHIF